MTIGKLPNSNDYAIVFTGMPIASNPLFAFHSGIAATVHPYRAFLSLGEQITIHDNREYARISSGHKGSFEISQSSRRPRFQFPVDPAADPNCWPVLHIPQASHWDVRSRLTVQD